MACNCIETLNAALEPHNTRLALTIVFGRGMPSLPTIGVEQIEKLRNSPKAKAVLPTFCPFCGAKYSVED